MAQSLSFRQPVIFFQRFLHLVVRQTKNFVSINATLRVKTAIRIFIIAPFGSCPASAKLGSVEPQTESSDRREFSKAIMGTLTYIRHGQARAFEKDSDQLSPLGEEQARLLGLYWVKNGVSFGEVYSGALIRQQRTAEIVGQCFLQAGLPWPEPQTTPDLNEYDADGISRKLIPAYAERDEKFRGLLAEFEANRNSPDRNRYFQRMFEVVTQLWLSGELEIEGFESWTNFRTRIRRALEQIVSADGSGRRVAVFTSGGVIGATVQTVLEAPERQALQINWRVKNCSLTEFTFGGGRVSLDTFNAIPHLCDQSLQSFR